MDYQEYLKTKRIYHAPVGFDVESNDIHHKLYPFQRDIVVWACKLGRAALFEDCGLGKTFQQLEWARLVHEKTGQPVIIFAPLAVSKQTEIEGRNIGIDVNIMETQSDAVNGINITNYEKLHRFVDGEWAGIVLDESSILKGLDGKIRKNLNEFGVNIPYRLCCTATPSPNDLVELSRHAEFLGIMDEKEIMALYFTQDGNSSNKWRLKGHAMEDFWKWMSSWCIAIRTPGDLGYSDDGYVLPKMEMHEHIIRGICPEGFLLPVEAKTMNERREARRASINDRCKIAAELINNSSDQWLVWCDLNKESELLTSLIPDAREVAGWHSTSEKESRMIGFSAGEVRVLVTKPTIAGFGMNWQNCNNMAFVGLSDSYEQQYQAIRRCWRFGQTHDVHVHVITADTEGAVVSNIKRKEKQAMDMYDNIVKHISVNSEISHKKGRDEMDYKTDTAIGDGWTLYLGDSVETIDHIENNSIGLSIFSPPFPGMYVYTNSMRDMGNVQDNAEMITGFSYLAKKILAKTMPGRNCAIHLTQGTTTMRVEGYTGLKDFRGDVIRCMESCGWIYYGEVCIDKNPQVKAIRTKDHGLMFKSLASDSSKMHMALADYILQFKKPGENPVPIHAGISEKYDNLSGWITSEEWIKWARPVWYGYDIDPENGINETDVLNVRAARGENDERHLCPLQLGVIERCIKLWSAPGELVYSPFAGIGSEGYIAIKLNREFVGGELKESYYNTAIRNLDAAIKERDITRLI